MRKRGKVRRGKNINSSSPDLILPTKGRYLCGSLSTGRGSSSPPCLLLKARKNMLFSQCSWRIQGVWVYRKERVSCPVCFPCSRVGRRKETKWRAQLGLETSEEKAATEAVKTELCVQQNSFHNTAHVDKDIIMQMPVNRLLPPGVKMSHLKKKRL